VTTSSRNPIIRQLIEQDGEEETKAFVKNHYNIPDNVNSWAEIDAIAYAQEKRENKERKNGLAN